MLEYINLQTRIKKTSSRYIIVGISKLIKSIMEKNGKSRKPYCPHPNVRSQVPKVNDMAGDEGDVTVSLGLVLTRGLF